ncbi:hypothetical protein ACFO1B_02765 [Dactylosporangium siamense]|uniref:Uncharacterized protein n=1 Tax=Dactylosporangium siamense TaxID=685454 RepID=A0A919PUC7_9ACTN|nr:hypothetical protein [Dactylosporangium siamense]GIG48590.1 hypothetical protein Dsi01nite_066310 [Dactylosporangium siamense]
MTSFGTGMLYMMADADLAEGPSGPAVAWLAEIAAVGLSRRFRETVGDRVVEFTYDGGEVGVRWLSDAEAAPILAAGGDWGDALRDWPSVLDSDLHLPNCTAGEAGNVEADGLQVDGSYFTPIELTIAGLREALADREDLEDREFLETEVLARLEFCRTHDLVFVVY